MDWNRQRFIKDPSTGKTQARLNPESDSITEDVPHLRIIDQDLWDHVKSRQSNTRRRVTTADDGIRSERARRPRYLLSGLLKCGVYGGGFSKISQHHYGCSTARNTGTCANPLSIRRDRLEAAVLDGLKHHLMHPDCVQEFVSKFHREMNRLAAAHDIDRDRIKRDLDKTERHLKRIVQAIRDGVPARTLKDELSELEARKASLLREREEAPPPTPRFHPNLASLYRQKVANLAEALNEERTPFEAAEAIRALVDEVRLVPKDGNLKIELFGELAAFVNLANEHPRSKGTGVQVTMVGGSATALICCCS